MTVPASLPTTMRAAVLESAGVVRLAERPVPEPEPDEILVQVTAVGVCGSDVHYYRDGRIGDFVVEGPLVLGHEVGGRVVAVGSGVDAARVGERVSIEPQRPCRVCSQCKAGRYNLCPQMRFYATPPVDGAFCDYVTIQADFAYPVPDSVSDDAAALMEPLSVGLWAAGKAGIGVGSRVLIAGAGPIGAVCAQVARAFGAAEVIVADPVPARRDAVRQLGATVAVDPARDDVTGLAVDAFIDASGAEPAVVAGIRAVRPGGSVVLVGMGSDTVALPIPVIQTRELKLTGVFRYAGTWPAAVHLVSSGAVDLDALVTARFGLEQAEQALQADHDPAGLKAMVLPG